jgi:hypothetical protein
LIKDAIGGHVLIRREPGGTNEILIMDHPDPEQAVKIWRWNMGGLGYSDNVVGADNPDREYTIAMTMDGAINADFVRTGEINTNLVKILGNSNFYWDGDYLYIVNPADGNQQIRLSKEGIRFTRDGGQTWRVAMDFDGIRMEGQSQDGYTHYVGDGVRVYDEQGNLVGHLGSFEVPSGQAATFSRASVAYKQNGQRVAAGQPRFEQGKFDRALLAEEGTTNLLGVEDSSFEGGTTGRWSPSLSQISIVNDGWHGTKGLLVEPTGTNGRAQMLINDMVSLGDTLTFSAYAKLKSGTPKTASIAITVAGVGAYRGTATISSDSWTRITTTHTLDTLGSGVYLQLFGGYSTQLADVIFDGIQLEKRSYATSFTPGTRSPETLTIPTAGVLNPQEGTVEFWVYVNGVVRRNIANNWPTVVLIRKGSSVANWIWLHHNPAGTWVLQIRKEDGTITGSGDFSDSLTPDGWHYFAIRWNTQEGLAELFHNGVKRISLANVIFPAEYDRIEIGHRSGGSGDWFNGLIDDFRISSRARTDAEILAAYQSGQPLPVDEWTTWKSSFDGHLRNEVPIRKYGLRVIGGEIIAPHIEGGEMYSTSFQTGEKGASDYIKLSAVFDPLLVVNGNKEALSIWASNRGGFIQFFDPSADDMRGRYGRMTIWTVRG